jgi:hypothetical protein
VGYQGCGLPLVGHTQQPAHLSVRLHTCAAGCLHVQGQVLLCMLTSLQTYCVHSKAAYVMLYCIFATACCTAVAQLCPVCAGWRSWAAPPAASILQSTALAAQLNCHCVTLLLLSLLFPPLSCTCRVAFLGSTTSSVIAEASAPDHDTYSLDGISVAELEAERQGFEW